MPVRALTARPPRMPGYQTVLAVCLSVALLNASCSTITTHPPLQDLHIPGVVKIPGLTALQQHRQIASIATYVPAGTTGPARLLFHVGTIYEVGLDGSNLHSIADAEPCVRTLAPSPNGHWVACQDERGLELTSLVPGVTPSSVQILSNVSSEDYSSPTWSPDSQQLALVSGSLGGGCSIGVYGLSRTEVSVHLLAILTFPQFVLSGTPRSGCLLAEVSWSPDGNWFALLARGVPLTIYRMPVSGFLPFTVSASGAPVAITVTSDQLTAVGHTGQYVSPAWSMRSGRDTVTFVDADTFDIVQVDVVSLVQMPILRISDGAIFGLAWTPDGSHLAFVQCGPGSADFGPVPSQVYVYSPSS